MIIIFQKLNFSKNSNMNEKIIYDQIRGRKVGTEYEKGGGVGF